MAVIVSQWVKDNYINTEVIDIIKHNKTMCIEYTGLILGLHPASERRR